MFDEADTLSEEEKTKVEKALADIYDKYGIEVYIATKYDGTQPESTKVMYDKFVKDYYVGANGESGGVFVCDIDIGYYSFYTFGDEGEKIFPDDVIDNILDVYAIPETYLEGYNDLIAVCKTAAEDYRKANPTTTTTAPAGNNQTGAATVADDKEPTIASRFITDEADLFTAEEETKLLEKVDEIRSKYNIDVVLHTTDSLGGKTVVAYADDYYDYNEYADDGLVFMLCMGTRDYYTSTKGRAIDVINDSAIKYLGEEIVSDLSAGNYYEAFDLYLNIVDGYFNAEITGETYPPYTASDYIIGECIVIGVAFLIAWLILKFLKKKMDNTGIQSTARSYIIPGTLNIYNAQDNFVRNRTERVRVVHETHDDDDRHSGSTTHVSSSGDTHGGGGGKF